MILCILILIYTCVRLIHNGLSNRVCVERVFMYLCVYISGVCIFALAFACASIFLYSIKYFVYLKKFTNANDAI